jgi:hypothetical protein
MAYRSFRSAGFAARGVRKVTTGINLIVTPRTLLINDNTMEQRQYEDFPAQMERPWNGYSLEENYHPIVETESLANALRAQDIDELVAHLRQSRQSGLRQITVSTGGGRNGIRWPDKQTEYLEAARTQMHPPAKSKAWTECLQPLYPDKHYNSMNINIHQLLWRHQHPLSDGSGYRKVLADLEVSHLAEAYHSESHPRVELLELEKSDVNESRKICSKFGLMWRKAGDGSRITPDQINTYVGPTMCPHAAAGSPCYGPFPSDFRSLTGTSPGLRQKAKRKQPSSG